MSDPLKAVLQPFADALYDATPNGVNAALKDIASRDAVFQLAHPFETMNGAEAYFQTALEPLMQALPDVERRQTILISGQTVHGDDWVGSAGFYCGTFEAPFLDIPPTGHVAHMRFHEFFRISDGRVVEMQALWDLPELMMQAGAWPMAPSLGRDWAVPGPAQNDGICIGERDEALSAKNTQLVVDMLTAMKRHPREPVEAMELDRFWHPRMNWYGPAGIGTARGISGFRNWHQIPFLNAMPDRGQYVDEITYHFFGENAFVGVTGWPDMIQTLDQGGWMGIAPVGRKIEMRSLDFWRIEDGKIRENWVLVDLLHVYAQLGVDVLARMREFNKARPGGKLNP